MSKKIWIPTIILVVVTIIIIVIFSMNKSNAEQMEFSATDVFDDIDFDHKIESFTFLSISRAGSMTELVLSEQWQQKLVNAIKQSKFEKPVSNYITPYYDYSFMITLNDLIYINVDTNNNIVLVHSFDKNNFLPRYAFKDKEFFELIEEAVKNASIK